MPNSALLLRPSTATHHQAQAQMQLSGYSGQQLVEERSSRGNSESNMNSYTNSVQDSNHYASTANITTNTNHHHHSHSNPNHNHENHHHSDDERNAGDNDDDNDNNDILGTTATNTIATNTWTRHQSQSQQDEVRLAPRQEHTSHTPSRHSPTVQERRRLPQGQEQGHGQGDGEGSGEREGGGDRREGGHQASGGLPRPRQGLEGTEEGEEEGEEQRRQEQERKQ